MQSHVQLEIAHTGMNVSMSHQSKQEAKLWRRIVGWKVGDKCSFLTEDKRERIHGEITAFYYLVPHGRRVYCAGVQSDHTGAIWSISTRELEEYDATGFPVAKSTRMAHRRQMLFQHKRKKVKRDNSRSRIPR